MICPHCLVGISAIWDSDDPDNNLVDPVTNMVFRLENMYCSECTKLIIRLAIKITPATVRIAGYSSEGISHYQWIYPTNVSRKPISKKVPSKYLKNYNEAVQTLLISPNASAALSRRLLQVILEDKANITKNRLKDEIKEAKKTENFDSYLLGLIDFVREFGNFGTHANIDISDQIIDVEEGEAEFMLEITEALFEHYFVKPDLLKDIKEKLGKNITKKKDSQS